MIDVGQGDCGVISLGQNGGNLLIDSCENNIEVLKSMGITKLDAILITHSDSDHIGSAFEALKEFDCDTLISSKFDFGEEMVKLRKEVKKNYLVGMGDRVRIKKIDLQVLGPCMESKEINNNSIVFLTTLKSFSFLYTGDMEIEEEETLFRNNLKVDFLKVPHHGSSSSMGSTFMSKVDFNVALISVGKSNSYNHPAKETLEKLKGKDVYMTKEVGTVTFVIQNKDVYVIVEKTSYFDVLPKRLNLGSKK